MQFVQQVTARFRQLLDALTENSGVPPRSGSTLNPRDGFAGEYNVRYFFENGDFSDEYDLVIARTGDIYKATWLIEGKTAAIISGIRPAYFRSSSQSEPGNKRSSSHGS